MVSVSIPSKALRGARSRSVGSFARQSGGVALASSSYGSLGQSKALASAVLCGVALSTVVQELSPVKALSSGYQSV